MSMHGSAGDTLARFSSGLTPDHLPDDVRSFVKLVVLDSLGCMVAGRGTDDAGMVAAAASASLAGGDGTAPSVAAQAMTIGYEISASGSMDSYVPAKLHTTPSVLGAALAVAADRGARGEELLCAVAAGLESAVRIADALDPPVLRARGWHSPGVVGPLSAALASSRLLGLDAAQTTHALGLAGSQSSGTFAAWGTPTVKFHQARGAMSGVLSAHLAATGFTSSGDVFGAPDGGLLAVYSGGGHPGHLTDGLGERWRMGELSLRRWPTPHVNVVAAIRDLVAAHGDETGEAEKVVVEISKEAEAFHVFDSPTSRFEAMNSIPLSAATALLVGSFDQEHLEADWYAGDAVRSCMRERIQVSVSPELPSGSVRAFSIPLRSDRNVVEVHVPLGSAQRPIGRTAIVEKFVRNVQHRLSAPAAADLAAEVLALEAVPDMSRIVTQVV